MYTNLRTAMAQKGITIEAVARLLNVHRNTIQNKLEGSSDFTIEQAFIITEIMFPEYKLAYLFHRDEAKAS